MELLTFVLLIIIAILLFFLLKKERVLGINTEVKIEDNKIRVLTMEMIVAIPTRKAFE